MVKKILILRFSAIGDIVLTTPVVRCIKKQVPGAEVHYATKAGYQPVLAGNPYIDKWHLLKGSLRNFISALKKEQFDYIIDLHHNLRTLQIKLALGGRSRSFYKANIPKWLMVNLKVDRLPKAHIVDRYMAAASPLGIENDLGGLDYFIPPEDIVPLDTLPPLLRDGYIGFVIGAKFATKKLPEKKIINICNLVKKPVVLLGGPEDREMGERIRLGAGPDVFNACGQYSINQSASLVKQAHKIISHDTGLMHIAAAFKKEIISIWGNTIPEFGMYPYYGQKKMEHLRSDMMEVDHLPCRPCSKIGFSRCPQKHFLCMRNQDDRQIAKVANK